MVDSWSSQGVIVIFPGKGKAKAPTTGQENPDPISILRKQDREGPILGGIGPKKTMFAHLIKTQHKAQGLTDELSLVHKERVDLGPYHNGPNPEVGIMAEETITWGSLKWSAKHWPRTKEVRVKHEPSEISSWGLIMPLGNHHRTLFGIWNKFQGNPWCAWNIYNKVLTYLHI